MRFKEPMQNNLAWMELSGARERAAYTEADRRVREARDQMLGVHVDAKAVVPHAPAASTEQIDFWSLPSPRIATPSHKSQRLASQKSDTSQQKPRKKMGRPRLESADALHELRARVLELRAQRPDLTVMDLANIMGWSRATAFRRLKEMGLHGGSAVSEVR